MSLGDQFVEKL